MSISKLATGGKHIAIFLACCLASIPAAELAFRVLGDAPSFDLQGLYAPFAAGGYKYGAGIDTDAYLASGRLSVSTDGLGLRCDKERRFATRPGEAIDVLLMGDSQGFGNGVNFEDTIGGTMAGVAAAEGYRVANASVGGHSLASQLEVATWLVEEQRLKVRNFVLLLTPAIIENPDKLNRAAVGEDGRLYGEPPNWRTKLRLWGKTHAVVYSRIRDAVRNLGIGAEPAKTSSTVFEFYEPGHREDMTRDRLLAAVRSFHDFAVRHGATVHLAYVPLTVEADFAPLQQAAAANKIALDRGIPFRIATNVAGQLNLSLHDLRPALERTHAEGHILNVIGDFHYSPVLSKACGLMLWAGLNFPAKGPEMTAKTARK